MATKPTTSAMLFVGNQLDNVKTASEAIVAVLKAAVTEGAQVAACNALAEIARAPANTTLNNCTFLGTGKR
jgi:hypothetical protein